jgi:hypothetical protein
MEKTSGSRNETVRVRFFELVHHLVLAGVISSAMLVLESTAIYRALDNFTHFYFGSSKFWEQWGGESFPPARASQSIPGSEYPQILILAPELQFAAIGPHYKSLLAGVVRAIVKQKPRLIAFTIDVAPIPEDLDKNQGGLIDQRQLNQALDDAARSGVDVILLTPAVGPDPVGQVRYDWLRDRCAAGIRFGLPVPRPTELPVYDYSRNSSSVGLVASRVAGFMKKEGELNVCAIAKEAGRNTQAFTNQIDQRRPSRHDFTTAVPLNTVFFARDDYFRAIQSAGATEFHPQPTIEIGHPLPKNAAVFIGDDNYSMRTFGNQYVSPAVLFAAEFFSEKYPVQHSLSGGFFLHMGLGVLLGYLFGLLWDRYAVAAVRLEATPLTPWPEKLRALLVARGWLLIALASLPIILMAIFRLSGWMLRRDLWMNPLPLVFGMFIDALLHSRHKASHRSPAAFLDYLDEHPDLLWQLLFVAIVLTYFFALKTH